MSEWKVTASHRSRAALIYVRQSTLVQVERNRESTARQYDLVSRARELGWPRTAVTVIDEDLGVSGGPATTRCSDIRTRRFVPRTDLCRVGTRSSCGVGDGRLSSRNKSEALQEGKEWVWCPVAAGGGAGWGSARQRSLFEREIGVQVDAVGGFNLLVTEP